MLYHYSQCIYNSGTKKDCERIAKHIRGKTYMDFRADVVKSGRNFSLIVQSDYPAPEDDIEYEIHSLMVRVVLELDQKANP